MQSRTERSALVLLPFVAVCAACALVPQLGNLGEARILWTSRTWPNAPWIALVVLAVLAVLGRRPHLSVPERVLLTRPRLTLLIFVGTALFVLLADRSMSGDFLRVLLDIDRGVWLLKAEPLGPAAFQVLAALSRALGFPPILGLQWLLALISSLGPVLLWKLAGTLDARSDLLRELRFVALLSSATSALFFGHIETYTLPTLAMLAYLLQAQRVLAGEGQLRVACGVFALACALHMQMLCLGPSLLVCALFHARRESRWTTSAVEILLFAALPVIAIQALCLRFPPPYPQYYGGGDQTMLVKLATLESAHYWLGALGVLCTFAPGALAALGTRLTQPKGEPERDGATLLALAVAGPWLAFVLLWNPDLGYARDWDLFAPAGVALTFAALLWPVAGLPRPTQALALCALTLLNLMRTIPFVLDNARG